MSRDISLRVADALCMIADHVRKNGVDHPEGLVCRLPILDTDEELTVTAQIMLESAALQHFETANRDRAQLQSLSEQRNRSN